MDDRASLTMTTSRQLARAGGRILVDALRIHGVDRIFCVPGESYLDVLDALHDTPEIDVVVAKHEGAAANMAEADGKLTGRPGICFVTRGPGATHASVGVHTAMQDSTPMILFIGQIDRAFKDREGFQEVDYRAMFGGLAKWVAEIEDTARIPEYVLRAFQQATSGRPGPVVLSLPEDVLANETEASDTLPYRTPRSAAASADVTAIGQMLNLAKAPLLVLGGSGWTDAALTDIVQFAEALSLPVVTSFRRQDLFDNEHENYAGHLTLGISPKLLQRLKQADVLLVIGARLSEIATTGYSVPQAPTPEQQLIHIHPDSRELSKVYQAQIAAVAGMPEIAAALRQIAPSYEIGRRDYTNELHQEFLAFTSVTAVMPSQQGVDLTGVVISLSRLLPVDTIITNGAGNFSVWLHRFYRYRRPRTELAPTSGAMGYGLPAAVAAKLRHPARIVVCFAGDGDFLMYPQELSTAAQFGAPIIVIIVNNGLYGTIRMHQARRFPGHLIATTIVGPDMVQLAQACGAYAERVEATSDFEGALSRALSSGRVAVLDLITDPDQISPTFRVEDKPA